MAVHKKMPQYHFLGTIAPIIGGFLGYRGAKSQADQQAAQNALLQQQYEWQKSKETPGVTGAQNQLGAGRYIDPNSGEEVAEGTEGAVWQSQFQPFVDAAGQQSVAGSNIAAQYLANTPHYQQAGLQGLGTTQALLGTTPYQQQQLGQQFANPYAQAQYGLLAQDINRQFDRANRERAARSGGRLDALSSQQARLQGQLEKQRQEGLLRAATDIGSRSYAYGQDAANRYLANQAQLAQQLQSAGVSGLSQAQQASQLGQGAQQYGIQAPFLPFQQYGQTVSAQPTAQVPNFGTVTDPLSTGVGLGLQTYNLLNPRR